MKMSRQATKTPHAISHKAPIRRVTVPDQKPSLVRDAHAAANLLDKDSRLATFAETVWDVRALTDSKDRYVLAVDPKDLPKEAGWYRVVRSTRGVNFKPMTETRTQTLRREGRGDEVLYVSQNAVNAAKEGRPLALDADYGGRMYLYAGDWPDYDARVALVKLEVERMLRLDEGKVLKVTFRDGEERLLPDVAEAREME